MVFLFFKSSHELAKKYNINTLDRLIRNESLKAGVWGFITGFGGIVLLPVTLPLNIIAVLFIQLRMISAIAIIGKYDLNNEHVVILVKSCILGDTIKEILKKFTIKESEVIAKEVLEKLTIVMISKISSKMEFRLAEDVTKKITFSVSRFIPFISGIIGFIIDSLATFSVGYVAKEIFILKDIDENEKIRHKNKFIQLIIILSINAAVVIMAIIIYLFAKGKYFMIEFFIK
ncbi:conserved hypothetical protein [Lebetimonas natsushimae]|uniref:Uncharacterized protein n=1 Tax=Lebetimonas natsushimae TaxID=1936991 RepID=A0A292YFS8_9BACT|nr:EcsC family protein [Lebetimonas natsushimae]GAX87855.1 conserved hypothetical protein [Lebetimonas natsushimae]